MTKDNKHLIDLRGKAYLTVAGRIQLFREDFPIGSDTPGRIVTERTTGTDGRISVRAEVYIGQWLVATGHAEEPPNMNSKNIGGRILEKVETSAIGRALGAAGYGTDKAFEDDEQDGDVPFIADAPREAGVSSAGKAASRSSNSQPQSAPTTEASSGASDKPPRPRARQRGENPFEQLNTDQHTLPNGDVIEWPKFWTWVKSIGLSRDEVHDALRVESVKDWDGSKADMMAALEKYASSKQAA